MDLIRTFPEATPHGDLQQVEGLDNFYTVEGSCNMGGNCAMTGRTMAIYKLDNELIIFNSMRVTEDVEKEILKLGKIKHVIRMADSHGLDDPYYVFKFKPTYWSLDSFKPVPGGPLQHDKTLVDDDLPIPGMKMVSIDSGKECVFWIPDYNGTLISGDIIQNTTEIPIHSSWFGGKFSSWAGFLGECNCAPPLWKMVHGKNHKKVVETILSWDFENLVTAHGSPKIGGAKALCAKHFESSLGKL